VGAEKIGYGLIRPCKGMYSLQPKHLGSYDHCIDTLEMNYPAASCGVSSSVVARHSVLDTESSRVFWIPASAGMTNSRQAAGCRPLTK